MEGHALLRCAGTRQRELRLTVSLTANRSRGSLPKRFKLGGAFIPTLIILGLLLLAVMVFAQFWTELKWFEQIGAARVFWTRYGALIALGVIGIVICYGVFVANIAVMLARRTDLRAKAQAGADANIAEKIAGGRWISRLFIPLGLAVIFGTSICQEWQTFLLWFNGGSFGVADPEYGLDVSFYVFTLPAIHALTGFFSTLVIVCLVLTIVGYWILDDISITERGMRIAKRAQLHFGVLAALAALLVAINYWLSRYDLLLGNNQRFSGASYTDINASKPGLTILAIAAFVIAALFLFAAIKHQWKAPFIGIAAGIATALVVTTLYPALVQNFKVNPNAAELESTYIQRNIDATLNAYGMANVQSQQYDARTDVERGQLRQDSETAAQIRLLDPNIVDPSFNQLQQNRQYYQFREPLTVDRYTINGQTRDTVIAVRELNLDGLDESRRSWVNDHTVFTHGFGVAAAYGNTVTPRGDPTFWEAGIPSVGELGSYEPRVYFGKQSPDYSIVGAPEGADPWELDYPDDKAANGQVMNTYTGDGGPSVSNVFSRMMFAIRMKSTELFFSDRVTENSQILFDRDPHVRVEKVAPYLTLDSKAVPAVIDMDNNPQTPKQLVWIIDGYTTSNNYPYSARETLGEVTQDALTSNNTSLDRPDEINYIRNSVKAVVNAYDGSVTLYQWDMDDPIINAWKAIFPGQISDLSAMPGDLIAHVRYPEDLFKVQRALLARYHVRDAKSFYSGGDFWQVPLEPTLPANTQTPKQPPYYLTLKMPGQDQTAFSLTTSYIPGGTTNRNVMTGFLAASGDAGNTTGVKGEGYGQLRLLELPRDLTVPGPGQAENTMLTNPKVSTDLNLLRNGGTEIMEGNLLSLPIGEGLLYVQPIYVQASSGTQYPTLQYVLTLFGDSVGFAATLDESLNQVFGGESGVNAGDANIVGSKEPPVDAGSSATTPGANSTPGASAGGAVNPATPGGSTPAVPTPSDGSTPATPAPGSALDTALQDAKAAIEKSQQALAKGDWKSYGEAQDALKDAINRAVAAQESAKGK
ncbi:UPF0182 family protein [Trueperella sp. LYQ141]|uniref:UPF0182 family membrane protein n=1 Tax=Trueperella sp. LYQ141 TaxID=3391058 RepID=UPI003983AC80